MVRCQVDLNSVEGDMAFVAMCTRCPVRKSKKSRRE